MNTIISDRIQRFDQRQRNAASIGALAAVYFLAGKLGLSLAFFHPSATPIWPPTGIVLAALLIFGYRLWPGALLGAFLVNVTTAGSILTSAGIAVGNTLEGLAAAYLVTRFANGRKCFDRTQDALKFVILAGVLSTMISATFGVTTLSLGGFARWADYTTIWATWWCGDATSMVIVAPLLILWSTNTRLRWSWSRISEFALLLMSLLVVGQVVFGEFMFPGTKNYPLEYLCTPFLIWAAFRFGRREAATVSLVLCGIAIRGTLHGLGPFAIGTKNESLLLLQAFLGIVATMTMVLAVMSQERRNAEEQIRNLAVTDPLTGLANYGKLIDALDLEMRRFGRTHRSFAILLLDLDGLKVINDTHGHLAGSRALCRVADILRIHCREIDTAARYGGDEFALVIPEAGTKEARQVAARIRDRVARDPEAPHISVSVGAAVYPRDGETKEALLAAADRVLYEVKRRTHHGLSRSLRMSGD
jgi:diguanylate cyclase (GGDEF)-like protein